MAKNTRNLQDDINAIANVRRSPKASDYADEKRVEELDKISDEDRIVSIVQAAAHEAQADERKEAFDTQYEEAWCMVEGDQYPESQFEESPPWRLRATRNKVFGAMRSIEGLLMDAVPVPYIVADYPGTTDEELRMMREQGQIGEIPFIGNRITTGAPLTNDMVAKKFSDLIHAQLERDEEHMLLSYVVSDMVVGGLAVVKMFWDSNNNAPGMYQYDPRDVFVDPYCTDRRRRTAKYLLVRKEMDADDVKRQYKVGKERMDRVLETAKIKTFDEEGLYRRRSKAPYDGTSNPFDSRKTFSYERPRIEVWEMWFRRGSIYELEHDDDKGARHPNGRVLVVAGDVLLWDAPNPYDHGEIPFVFFQSYGNPRDPYGFGCVKPIAGNQIALNVLTSLTLMNVALMSNSQWIVEEGALAHGDPSNRPGLIIEAVRGAMDKIRKIEGSNVPGSVFNIMEVLSNAIEEMTNVNDITTGGMPKSHTSAEAIQLQQNSNFARIRELSRSFESSYKAKSYLYARLFQQFGSFTDPNSTGRFDMGEWLAWDEKIRTLTFDVKIESKAEVPAGLMGKLQFAGNAMQMGLMDAYAAAKFVGIPMDDRSLQDLDLSAQLKTAQVRLQLAQLEQQAASAGNPQAPVPEGAGQPAPPQDEGGAPMPPAEMPMA